MIIECRIVFRITRGIALLVGEVYHSLDKNLHAQYYIVYALMKDHGYDAKAIFKGKLENINELIRESRIEEMYEEGAGVKLMERVCKMAESSGHSRKG